MSSIERFDVGARLSEMAVHNGTIHLAGQVPADARQDMTGQTRQVLAAIDRLLAEAGSDLPAFYARVKALAALQPDKRKAALMP